MVTVLGMIFALVSAVPQASVSCPEHVAVGEIFNVELMLSGTDVRSASCVPSFSSGLQYFGSSTAQSFSSITTPQGTAISSEVVITLSFIAVSPGEFEIGPFSVTSAGMGLLELPSLNVTASGAVLQSRFDPAVGGGRPLGRAREGDLIWIEAVMADPEEHIYPGSKFYVDYYACTESRSVQRIQTSIAGSEFAASRLVDSPPQLEWRKYSGNIMRSLILRLEVTPAFACTLSLPVVSGIASIRSGLHEADYNMTPSDGWIPIYPFPDFGMPDNFAGVADSISFTLTENTRGYSQTGERSLLLRAFGPGALSLVNPPAITLSGPGIIEQGIRMESGETVEWQLLIAPSDSGIVVLGPDSVAWFDREMLAYRQSFIPEYRLHLRQPSAVQCDPVLPETGSTASVVVPILSAFGLLCVVIFMLMKKKSQRTLIRSIEEAADAEELLTILEKELSRMLVGSSSYMGSEELAEAMDDRAVDRILSRRILRLWKNIEMSLSGRGASVDQLELIRRNTMELLETLSTELEQTTPD